MLDIRLLHWTLFWEITALRYSSLKVNAFITKKIIRHCLTVMKHFDKEVLNIFYLFKYIYFLNSLSKWHIWNIWMTFVFLGYQIGICWCQAVNLIITLDLKNSVMAVQLLRLLQKINDCGVGPQQSVKVVSASFYQIFIFHQMIALQKLW